MLMQWVNTHMHAAALERKVQLCIPCAHELY